MWPSRAARCPACTAPARTGGIVLMWSTPVVAAAPAASKLTSQGPPPSCCSLKSSRSSSLTSSSSATSCCTAAPRAPLPPPLMLLLLLSKLHSSSSSCSAAFSYFRAALPRANRAGRARQLTAWLLRVVVRLWSGAGGRATQLDMLLCLCAVLQQNNGGHTAAARLCTTRGGRRPQVPRAVCTGWTAVRHHSCCR